MDVPDLRSFNFFDWFLVAVVAYSTIAAIGRGFFREVFTLVGLVAGILLASWNYSLFSVYLERVMPWTIAQVIAFMLIAITTMMLCGVAGTTLQKAFRTVGLGFLDRALGGLFGFSRGCLMCVALLMVGAAFLPQSYYLRNSQLSGYFLQGAHAVSFVVPTNLQQHIREGVQQLHHKS